MKGKRKYSLLVLIMIITFVSLSFIFSFAGTTTYQYDDTNRKVTVTHGTQVTSTYSISGIVTNSNGTALSGITISLTGALSSSTTTDSNGFYGFSGLGNGNYTITPTPWAYTFSPVNRSVTISGVDAIAQNFTGTAVPPPAAPSGLTAATISSSQINLSWVDNSNNETGFKIERKPSGGSFSQIATVNANAIAYSDVGLTGNTTYYYQVRAYNGGGDSGYSNVANAATSCSTSMVRIGSTYYSTLQAAYNAAVSGNTIQTRAGTLTENISINRNISVTLQGGYDCNYTTNSGNVTYLKGMLQTFAGGGTLTISNFNITIQ